MLDRSATLGCMFSRRNRRASSAQAAQPTGPAFSTAEVAEAWAQLDAGDVPGALRKLRPARECRPDASRTRGPLPTS